MSAKLTRRKLAAAMLAPAAAAAVQLPAPAAAEDSLVKAALEHQQANFAAVSKVKLPMSTAPDFQFKA